MSKLEKINGRLLTEERPPRRIKLERNRPFDGLVFGLIMGAAIWIAVIVVGLYFGLFSWTTFSELARR